MGGLPKDIMTDGEGAKKNRGLCQKYITEHHNTYIPPKRHPVCAERMIRTCREMLDKRIKPDEQWTDLIYSILLTFTHEFVHSTTELTPNAAGKESNEVMTHINMNMKAQHNRRRPELHVGDTVNNI